MLETPGPQFSRRALLAAASAATLTACATHTDGSDELPLPANSDGNGEPVTPTSSGVSPQPATSPAQTPQSTTPPVPTRDEIVARFVGRTPTQWSSGEFAPIKGLLTRTDSDKIVLTLDCCGGPGGSGLDQPIFDLLRREHIPAVLFLNQRRIQANRAVFGRFASQPELFEIGNHGTRHMPLSVSGRPQYGEPATRDVGEVYDEVMGNHQFLIELLGKPPRFFRTGTAWYDEVALEIVKALGETAVGFDVNGDAGTTFPRATVAQEVGRAQPGSIIICHANQPTHATAAGLSDALPRMKARGVKFATLSVAGA